MVRFRVLGAVLVLALSAALVPAVPVRSQISLEEVEARSVEYTVELFPVQTPTITPSIVQALARGTETVRLPSGTLQGRSTTVFEVTAPYNVSTVRMFMFMNVRSVRAEGHEVRARESGNDLILTFPTPLRPGTRVTLHVEFEGETFPLWNDYTWVGGGEIYPLLISPFGDFNQNRSSIRGTITAPAGMTIVSAGSLVTVTQSGSKRTWRYESDADTERTVVLGGPYVRRTVEGGPVPIDFFTVRGGDQNVPKIADWLTKAYQFQSRYIGPLPYKRITVATFPSYWEGSYLFGVAYPGILMLNDLIVSGRYTSAPFNRDSFQFSTVAHELSHGYWGMEVQGKGAGWRCIWECFAEYSGLITVQEVMGERAFQQEMDEEREDYLFAIGRDRPITAYTAVNSGAVGSLVIYAKGALVLHMLRYVLGEAKFQQLLSSLVRENRHKAIRIETVQEFAERLAGEPLNWFFQQWFYQVVVPDYQIVSASSVAEGGSGYRTTATVRNAGTGTMPVEVGFVQDNNAVVTGKVTVGSREEKTVTVTTERRVTKVIADPGRWLLQSNYKNDEGAVR
ncbi:MAG TPA: M1 family aminopeptidase [bacterium]|nr:M1 family aminopeptidase [bacterium]